MVVKVGGIVFADDGKGKRGAQVVVVDNGGLFRMITC